MYVSHGQNIFEFFSAENNYMFKPSKIHLSSDKINLFYTFVREFTK